jgi:hypothetical protein
MTKAAASGTALHEALAQLATVAGEADQHLALHVLEDLSITQA